MKMSEDRMKWVLDNAIVVVEDLLRCMYLTKEEEHDFILNRFGINEDEYNYIRGGKTE